MRMYQLVRVTNSRYLSGGIRAGDIGTVLDLYDDVVCEVEFSHPDRTTYALQAIRCEDLTDAEE